MKPENALEIARKIGFPVLIKATAGGGGRGMKVAKDEDSLEEAISTARSEAAAAFGNDAVYMEKYLGKPRHIEIQVVAMARAMPSISASGIVRCSAATRRSGKRPTLRRSMSRSGWRSAGSAPRR